MIKNITVRKNFSLWLLFCEKKLHYRETRSNQFPCLLENNSNQSLSTGQRQGSDETLVAKGK